MNKLIPKMILQELLANDEMSQQGMSRLDMVPVLRLFSPDAAATWVLVSGAEVEGDVLLFGWCDLGLGQPEYGDVSLTELQTLRGTLGLPVERDICFATRLRLEDYVDDLLTAPYQDLYA